MSRETSGPRFRFHICYKIHTTERNPVSAYIPSEVTILGHQEENSHVDSICIRGLVLQLGVGGEHPAIS